MKPNFSEKLSAAVFPFSTVIKPIFSAPFPASSNAPAAISPAPLIFFI